MEGSFLLEARYQLGLSTLLYAVAFGSKLYALAKDKNWDTMLFSPFLYSGFLFHSWGLYSRGLAIHSLPMSNPFEILQVIGWSAILLVLTLRMITQMQLLSFFGTGLAALLGILSLQASSWDYAYTPRLANNPWIPFHAALAIFSYSLFSLAALTALMYLIQDYGLSTKRGHSLFSRLPALNQLDLISSRFLQVGVILLSMAVVLGSINWLEAGDVITLQKLIAAWAIWGAYLSLLLLKHYKKLLPRAFCKACLALFILALLALWPLNRGLHARPPALHAHHG